MNYDIIFLEVANSEHSTFIWLIVVVLLIYTAYLKGINNKNNRRRNRGPTLNTLSSHHIQQSKNTDGLVELVKMVVDNEKKLQAREYRVKEFVNVAMFIIVLAFIAWFLS